MNRQFAGKASVVDAFFDAKEAVFVPAKKIKNMWKKLLTIKLRFDKMINVADKSGTERYRSGHNEAVLKTVCPQGRVGSNPTLSAEANKLRNKKWYSVLEKYPRGWRDTPGKGAGR